MSTRPWTLLRIRGKCDVEGDCWIWRLSCNSAGKPQANIEGRIVMVGRWVLERVLGRPIRDGYGASNRCGNLRCVSPFCVAERRPGDWLRQAYADGKRNPARAVLYRRASAIRLGRSKLTPELARAIRERRGEPAEAVAPDFGVSVSVVRDVWSGRRWAEVLPGASVFTWARAA